MWSDARGPGWRSRRRLRFTGEGRVFVLTSVGIGLAAVNTGSNALYLILGVFLSLVLVSGVLSEWMVWRVGLRRGLPPRAFAGVPYAVEIEMRNLHAWAPIVSIEVEDLREDSPADKRCFFLRVAPAGSQVAVYRRTTQTRGLVRFVGFRLVTRFPFGFFEKSVRVNSAEDFIVFPAIGAPTAAFGHGKVEGVSPSAPQRVGQEETFSFRAGTALDGMRDIAWKLSARGTGVVAHERSSPFGASDRVVFVEQDPGPGFEEEVTRCASLLVHGVGRGLSLSFVYRGGAFAVSPGAGLDAALRELALAQPIVSRETIVSPGPGRSVSRETPPANAPAAAPRDAGLA